MQSRNLGLYLYVLTTTVLLDVRLDGVDESLDAALDDDVDDAAAQPLVAPREFKGVRVVRAAGELLPLPRVLSSKGMYYLPII